MGLLDKIFGPRNRDVVGTYFQTMSAYAPAFTSRDGGLYEMELTRSAVHAFANLASKLKPEVVGSARPQLGKVLQLQPNPWMNAKQFIYRVATIVEVENTTFIVPILDAAGNATGQVYPLRPSRCEVIDVGGEPWLRYTFSNGRRAAIEYSRVGVITRHQYKDDFFGTNNDALTPTLDLLHLQREGMSEGVKSSAAIRFIGRLAGTLRPEDIERERDRFSTQNLSAENHSGLMLVDAKYADIKQIESKQFLVDSDQMRLIQTNVYNYFGINEAILQNSFDEEQWNAYYEGKIEPFALDLSLVMTNMIFTPRELATGNAVLFSSNRLQYASNATKLQVTRELLDRGIISNWGAAEIWNLPSPPGEERWVIRGEYIDIANLPTHTIGQARTYLSQAPTPDQPVADEQEPVA